MLNTQVPVLGFAAFSGTGKTTLITCLLPLLKKQGLSIGLIKHSHHNFEIDKPGKDSFRFREAGASPVMLVSKYRRAIITEMAIPAEPCLADQLSAFDQNAVDLILVEGFKRESFPKIEVHRPSLRKPLLYPNDSSIIAIATDGPLPMAENLKQLDLNKPQQIADFILTTFLNTAYE